MSGTVLVTGGAGFIGSHVCERYLELGWHVAALDDLSTGAAKNVAHLGAHPRFRLVEGSVRDAARVAALTAQADLVIHLAAAVGVRLIIEKPVHTIETNVGGTENVLAAAARAGRPVFLASSSEVYGKGAAVPFREDGDVLLGPTVNHRWLYACSKLLDEFLALGYSRDTGLDVVVGRLFNTVGPRQTGRYGMVLPRLVAQALAGQPLTVYGSGRQTRCFTHVSDSVRAIVSLMEAPAARGQVVNIGSIDEVSILGLARMVLEVTGSRSEIRMVPYDEAYEPGFEDMERRVPAVDRVRELIGWRPERTLREIVADVADAARLGEG